MIVGIVGLGAIGSANKDGFEYLGHKVIGHDIKLKTSIIDLLSCEIIYVCVPTPQAKDGSCDVSIIESVIEEIHNMKYEGIVAIRSTVKPGFTECMITKFTNLRIAFVPEFLRERCAKEDFINNHKLLAVGCHDESTYNKIIECHDQLPHNHKKLSPTEAEVLKYFNNVYAALRITFANNMYELCQRMNCNYKDIKDAYILTGKAVDMYLDVSDELRGYGGMCLPKDTLAIASLMEEKNIDLKLIKTIHEDNEKFLTTVFDGMRM
jgi:UDPglucose 6-dehydrogenase